jgi:hypothetical protein
MSQAQGPASVTGTHGATASTHCIAGTTPVGANTGSEVQSVDVESVARNFPLASATGVIDSVARNSVLAPAVSESGVGPVVMPDTPALSRATTPPHSDVGDILASSAVHDNSDSDFVMTSPHHQRVLGTPPHHKSGDIKMNSPDSNSGEPELQGASRTMGGILRGHALGNVLNLADADPFGPSSVMHNSKGTVFVYLSQNGNRGNLNEMKPDMTVNTIVTDTLGPVLNKVGGLYSPI